MKKIRVGIAGGAGYTGGELLRLLIFAPHVELVFVHSNSQAGKFVYESHPDLFGDTDLKFASELNPNIDVLFLCLGHGESKKFLLANPQPAQVRIIDLSQDFRIGQASQSFEYQDFVYGLPEAYEGEIRQARHIANPGCFATCIQLGLLPLAANGALHNPVHITATTGSTGAGQSPSASTHFSWRNNNLSAYKTFEHQHLIEICASLQKTDIESRTCPEIHFVPMRGNFSRGILATIYTETELSLAEAQNLYETYYQHAPFTHLSRQPLDLKQVVGTNKCFVHLEKHGKMLLITSIIDNLLKGASGQAVQNMNLLFGYPQSTGLQLKGIGF